jgi:hypothetical protein
MPTFLDRHVNNGTLNRAFRRVITSIRVLTDRLPASRSATILPDDVFLVSYPRSGNTWSRFLISNLLHPEEPTTFANVESRIAEIYFNFDHCLLELPRPRMLKSHEPFSPRYPRVIYIVRDPRDVAVSFYHHNIKWRNIPENYPIEEFIPRFVAAEFDPHSGSWADNVKSWINVRQGSSNFLMLRYEDLKQNTAPELLRIAEFLRATGFPPIDASPEKLAQAVERSSPERMRATEKAHGGGHAQLKRTRLDKPFIRTASSGGWRSSLSKASVALIESEWGELMESLGYPLSQVLQEARTSESTRA